MPSLKHFEHIHFMLWSLIVGEIESITLKVWKLKSSNRSSRPEMFSKKGVLRNFAKFQKNTCTRDACNFIKKEVLAQAFSCQSCEFSKNTFSYRTPLVAASDAVQYFMYSTKQLLYIIVMRYPTFCGHKFKLAFGALRTFAEFIKFTQNGRLYYFLDRRQNFQAY